MLSYQESREPFLCQKRGINFQALVTGDNGGAARVLTLDIVEGMKARGVKGGAVLMVGAAAALLLFSFPAWAQADTALPDTCGLYGSGDVPPRGYGAAYNLFSPARETLLRAYCRARDVLLVAGSGAPTQYVWRRGFVWRAGAWHPFDFRGDRARGDWFAGEARAILPLAPGGEQTRYAVAYVCQWVEGAWKCGCRDRSCTERGWQLQAFSPRAAEVPPERAFSVYQGLPRLKNSTVVAGALSSYAAPPGARVAVIGTGFKREGNAVFLENDAGARYPARQEGSASAGRLVFVVPDAPRGVYRVVVENAGGRDERGVLFAVVERGTAPPALARFSPARGPWGSTITLEGEGFTREGNIVMTSYGAVKGVPSPDGTHLSFRFAPYENVPALAARIREGSYPLSLPVYFIVFNARGMSNQIGAFEFE